MPPTFGGSAAPAGDLGLRVIRGDGATQTIDPEVGDGSGRPMRALSVRDIIRYGFPNRRHPDDVNDWKAANLRHLIPGLRRVATARALRLPHFHGSLWLRVLPADGPPIDLGLVGLRVVTTAGVNFIVDNFQGTTDVDQMRYHGFGTGSTAEAVGDTALVTELTTQYTVDNTRPTGSQTENGANVFRTVGTLTVDSGGPLSMREHGIFDQAATGGGVLLDRTVYALITLETNDSLEATYDFTVTAGS